MGFDMSQPRRTTGAAIVIFQGVDVDIGVYIMRPSSAARGSREGLVKQEAAGWLFGRMASRLERK